MDVGSWLRSLGLETYEQAFRDNKIDGEVLPNLTAEDLKDLGVVLVGDRRRLLTAIAALREANAAVPKPSSVQVGPSLQAQPSSSDAERRQLTLMFCDLVGSTALSTELDPEDLRELINTYHTYCAERVTRFGGYVAKYMGDGVLAYFGYPEAHEDDAIRAINSGLSILNEIGSLPTRADYKPQIRVGIATGLVVVGDLIGQGSAQERNVVGETPNLAARLQSVAEPGTVVIAASTHQVARGLFEYRDIGELRLKGFGQPVHAWQVLGASDLQSRFEAFQTSGVTPLVGREEELTLLVRRWAQAQSSGGRAVLLTGEPGIGKSRITAAFCQQLEAGKHSRVRYFCSAHHQDSALHPIVAQLERAAGFARLDTPEAKVEKLKALFAFTGASNEDLALVAELLSLPNAVNDVAVRDMVPQRKRQKIFDALLHQLKTLASHRPLLIIFEDVHWIDPTSLELLAMMIEQAQQLPMLLLVTARPGFTPPWPSYAHMTTVQLTRLSRDEGAAPIRRVTEGKNLPTEVMDQILARTDGVPLFVEELTKMVLESTLLREQAGAYVLTSPLLTLAIPATLHDSLLARLNRLAPVMNVAQIGAAIGREFSHEVLSAVAGLPTDECAEALDRLVRSELVFRRGTLQEAVYTFKHALVRDAVYGTLLRNKRQELHARIAHTLEERFPEIVAAQPERLAQHCADAGLVEKAITYWHRAGKQALARSATAEASRSLWNVRQSFSRTFTPPGVRPS